MFWFIIALTVSLLTYMAYVGWVGLRRSHADEELNRLLEAREMTVLTTHLTPTGKLRFVAVDHANDRDVTGEVLPGPPPRVVFDEPRPALERGNGDAD